MEGEVQHGTTAGSHVGSDSGDAAVKSQLPTTAGVLAELATFFPAPVEQSIAPDDKYRARALAEIEARGFITKNPDGTYLCDPRIFANTFNFHAIKDGLGPLVKSAEYGGRSLNDSFYYLFKDLAVYSPQDYQRVQNGEKIEPRKLFYFPESEEAAFEIDKIRADRSYLGLWEFSGKSSYYPTMLEGKNSRVSVRETGLAALIYHPQYGSAARDENGTLVATYPDGTRAPINSRFFEEWGQIRGKDNQLVSSPAKFFMEECPHIVEAGLIRPLEDFRVQAGSKAMEIYGFGSRKPSDKGIVSIDGLQYNVGQAFAGSRGFRVYRISDELGAVVDVAEGKDMKTVKVFRLVSRAPTNSATENYVGARMPLFNPSELENPSLAEVVAVKHFEQFADFSNRVKKEANVDLSNLTVYEQTVATGVYHHYKEDPRFMNFVREHKLNGLRSLMVAEDSVGNIEQILELGADPNANLVFSEASAIYQRVNEMREALGRVVSPEERKALQDFSKMTTQHINRLLLASAVVSQNGVPNIYLVDMIAYLWDFRNEVAAKSTDDYLKMLDLYNSTTVNAVKTATLESLEHYWLKRMSNETIGHFQKVWQETEAFYREFNYQNDHANQTTGDTQKHLGDLQAYISKRKEAGEPITGLVVDIGCGDGRRITVPMTQMLREAVAGSSAEVRVLGVDLIPPKDLQVPGLSFEQGDFANIPLPDSSVSMLTATWSVLNDLSRHKLRSDSFAEVARVLNVGGTFFFDVPSLEGEGGYEQRAKEYHLAHPDTAYGTFEREFQSKDGSHTLNKSFYAFPYPELQALLEANGFEIEQQELWHTSETKQARRTIAARLVRKKAAVPASLLSF